MTAPMIRIDAPVCAGCRRRGAAGAWYRPVATEPTPARWYCRRRACTAARTVWLRPFYAHVQSSWRPA